MSRTEFPATKAYSKIYKFILDIDKCIRTAPQCTNSRVATLLDSIDQIVANTALEDRRDRFANPAVKKFHAALQSLAIDVDTDVYIKNAFGNAVRLDYGTGHELNFLCFLYTLVQQGLVEMCEVFTAMCHYFRVVRNLIRKFSIEPAGSHGLWGLDDYQFLPFLLGSSELHSSACVLDNLKSSCYKEAVDFIKETKGKGGIPIEFVAPKLYSMRNLKWTDVNVRLFRMYNEDVLRSELSTSATARMFGKFVVLEGIDKSGKTATIARLSERIRSEGLFSVDVLTFGFPNRNSATGQVIDKYLGGMITLPPEAAHLLFSANRWEMRQFILENRAVSLLLCDRYFYSGIVYTHAKGIDLGWCSGPDTGMPLPDLVFFIDTHPSVVSHRAGFGAERYERMRFLERVHEGYVKVLSGIPYCVFVNGNQSIDGIVDDILKTMATRLFNKKE
ncbi:UNVERIFIED_CONTAM: hypothetical protein PYX00_011505 [Menopon gallinae]|uniref:Serine/threonine-protein phosphatase 2A activator n=1 Tax=Menopon gallinae TaxID=328185 RepID=A0AAW2H7Q2_9NEOP